MNLVERVRDVVRDLEEEGHSRLKAAETLKSQLPFLVTTGPLKTTSHKATGNSNGKRPRPYHSAAAVAKMKQAAKESWIKCPLEGCDKNHRKTHAHIRQGERQQKKEAKTKKAA